MPNTTFKSVQTMTDDFTIDDFFDPVHRHVIRTYMKYDRIHSEKLEMTPVELVLRYFTKIEDRVTKEIIPFDESMLAEVRTLGIKYKLSPKETRWEMNRNKIWKDSDIIKFYRGLIANVVDASIVVYDVKECIFRAEEINSKTDVEVWKRILKAGYDYLPCDGTHKLDDGFITALFKYDYFNDGQSNGMFDILENTKITFVIKSAPHIESWSENYLYSTYGVKPTDAAIRAGIYGEVCKLIKQVSSEQMKWLSDRISGINRKGNVVPNHADEDLISKLSYFWINGYIGSEHQITNWYIVGRLISRSDKKAIKSIQKYLNILNNGFQSSRKSPRAFWWEWIFVCKEIENRNYKIDDSDWNTVVDVFTKIWITSIHDEHTYSIVNDNGNETSARTFSGYVSGLTTGFSEWFMNDFTTHIVDVIKEEIDPIELDKKTKFTMSDRWKIILRSLDKDTGMVRVKVNGTINGQRFNEYTVEDYKEYSLVEVFSRGDLFECDHIIPQSKGGRTVVENGEIVSRDYNNWKSNKVDS